jgi:16S rRNA (guanine966-N2)-methyltransferase
MIRGFHVAPAAPRPGICQIGSTMRVIAGEARGRRLKAPHSGDVRPMTDQIREALFSSLGERVRAAAFLDLYAGSGAIGIEALSRGASSAVFVEHDPDVAEVIRNNIATTKMSDRAEVIVEDVDSFVDRPPKASFDLVMVDPPFASGLPSTMLTHLRESGFVGTDSVVVVRLSAKESEHPGGGWEVVRERRYGDSVLFYLRPMIAP